MAVNGFIDQAAHVQHEIDRIVQFHEDITMMDILHLKRVGLFHSRSLLHLNRRRLSIRSGLSEEKSEIILNCASAIHGIGFISADRLLLNSNSVTYISTGSSNIDAILGGGIEPGYLMEISGASQTGKTELCHTLAVTSQLSLRYSGQGFNCGKCLYVDTSNSFKPHKIMDIALRFGLDPNFALNNVTLAKCYSNSHLVFLVKEANLLLANGGYNLLIIDSIIHHFANEYTGYEESRHERRELSSVFMMLNDLAHVYDIPCVITNKIIEDMNEIKYPGFARTATGGFTISRASITRLTLAKTEHNSHVCYLYNSLSLPESRSNFSIGPYGINDVYNNDII